MGMTVADLIGELQRHPPQKQVSVVKDAPLELWRESE